MKRLDIKDDFKTDKTPKKRVYLSLNGLFILNILIFIFTLSQAICLLMLSLTIKQDTIKYTEKGNVDYKVYLNQNDFYEQDFLDKDMVYVSSLIKSINTTFDYKFKADENTNINYAYEVIGEIVIYDNAKQNVFFKKDYKLVDSITQKLDNSKEFTVNKSLTIDYNYYNTLANRFRKNYGVSSKSDFIVKFKLKYKNDDQIMKIDESKEMFITIPLSENEVKLTTDSSKISEQEKVVYGKKHVVVDSSKKLISSGLLAIISVILFVYIILNLFEIRVRKNKYDAFIKKTLREYDRLIVNTTTPPVLSKNRIINVNTFQELLDVRDNLSIPIMYYVEEEHQRCVFYLIHQDETYMLKVNAKDLENKK